MRKRHIPLWVSLLTVLVFACGVAGLVHHAKLAMLATDTRTAMDALMPGLMYFMTGVGFAVLMIICVPPQIAAGNDKAAGQTTDAVDRLAQAVDDLKTIVERQQFEQPRHRAAEVVEPPVQRVAQTEDHWPRVIELLDEIRELSMMSDSQRKARFLHHSKRRKTLLLRQAINHVGAGQFAEAERILEQCTAAYANDEDVERVRNQLADARNAAALTAVDNVRVQVEDLMALSRWDEAMGIADRLTADYPSSDDAQALRDRIARERDIFRNAACQRLYDEIKVDVDHRDWRRALAGTQRLLEQFGDLPRAERIRSTVRTIQDNAEIQERQELEARIQELIRGRRFTDAAELAEEVIARFPASPQADKLRELLPKLRDHAVNHEAGDLVQR